MAFQFNTNHRFLEGKHAILSPSGYSWLGYSKEKMFLSYQNSLKKEEGTYLHDLASRNIKTRTKVAPLKKSFYAFINDAIGFRMESEVLLYYSDTCFGTADAIKFDEDLQLLRIHDLKTGVTKPSFKQLDIYAALFCLEYDKNPKKINFEQRLYQGVGFELNLPDPIEIQTVMDKIVYLDKCLTEAKEEYKGIFG